MDCLVHGVAKSRTLLSDFNFLSFSSQGDLCCDNMELCSQEEVVLAEVPSFT